MYGQFGTVDISLVSPFINAGYADYAVDAARWPLFSAYYQRVLSHPPVAKALAVEQEMMKAMGMG